MGLRRLRCLLSVLARLLNTGGMLESPHLTRGNELAAAGAGACSRRRTAGRREEADLDANRGRSVKSRGEGEGQGGKSEERKFYGYGLENWERLGLQVWKGQIEGWRGPR